MIWAGDVLQKERNDHEGETKRKKDMFKMQDS